MTGKEHSARTEQRTLTPSLASLDISKHVEAELRAIRSEHDVQGHSTHVARIERSHLVEANILVGRPFHEV